MKHLFMMAIIISCAATATAQTFYINNYWTNGSKKIAYVTKVYSYTTSAVAAKNKWYPSHYDYEIKKAFDTHLENSWGVKKVSEYTFNTFSYEDNKSRVESQRQLFIDRLKRDGYTVNISDFTWKPQD